MRSRFVTKLVAAGLGISLLGACSAESLAEFATEKYVESQTDGEVDINFGEGGLSVQTEEGDFSFALDEENGSLIFGSDEGNGVINFDIDEDNEQGTITFDTDEGSGVINFDADDSQDGASITFDTDQGSGVVNFDVDEQNEEGTITFDTDEGSGVINFGTSQAPSNWPVFIGQPTTLTEAPIFTSFADQTSSANSVVFAHDPGENFATGAIDRMVGAGFEAQNQTTSTDGTIFAVLANGDVMATVVTDGAGMTSITVITGG